MGVALCLLFLLWFASGMVMMYCDYPSVSDADRLSRAPILNPSKIRLSPQEAYARLQISSPPDTVRISTLDGRPVYRFGTGLDESVVYADDGQVQDEYPDDLTLRIAAAWTGQTPAPARVEQNTEEDQWTVSGEFAALRPMRKYTWPDGEEVYVSTVTGDVVQYSTRASRMGAYFGPIPHWLYFTPLRRHASTWAAIVIWASGLGTVAALFGLVIGVSMYSPSKRFRRGGTPSSFPYAGSKRWHATLGLIFGILACSWTFSGMLSMDPFPKWQGEAEDSIGARLSGALRGRSISLSDFDVKPPREALGGLRPTFPVKELEMTTFSGEPIYLAEAGPDETQIVPVRGAPTTELDPSKIVDVIRNAAQPYQLAEVRLVTEYESYYVDRHHRRPLPVIFVQLNNEAQSAYYIDPKKGRIVQSYNSASRRNRWLYHGLHSIDLPWLYKHRPGWDIAVLTLLLGGLSLCVTSIILAAGVARKKLEPLAFWRSKH